MSTSKIPDLRMQPLVDIDFDDIESGDLRNKARFLKQLFPELRIIFMYYTLMTFKADLDNSVACLTNNPPIKFFAKITELGKHFPESKMEQTRDVLIAEMGDFEAAKKRLQGELALDEVTAQTSIPPQDDQPSNDTTKVSSSPSTLTSTTTTSHINGIVKSFKISMNTDKFPTDRAKNVENEGGEPYYNEISQDKIALLFEFLGGRVSRYECEIALRKYDGHENRAFNFLSTMYNIMEDPDENEDVVEARSGGPLRRRGEESTITALHERRERVLQSTTSDGCYPGGGRRRAESPDSRIFKKARLSETEHAWESDTVEDEMDEDEGEDEFVEAYLAPAGKWLRNTYPNSSGITLKFDNDLSLRDNVPKEVLCNNFDFLKHAIDAATQQESGHSEIKISIPYVHADDFDLAMQFFICGNITLGEDTLNEERISAILAIIDTAIKLEAPLFATLINKMVSKLESILRRDYLALSNNHIRRAYEMGEDVAGVHKIFLSVAIKRQMQYTRDDSDGPFDDDDEDDMTAAQHAAYSGSEFVFSREKKRNPQFEQALMRGVLSCLERRVKVIKQVRRGNAKEISVPGFTVPLTKGTFEL